MPADHTAPPEARVPNRRQALKTAALATVGTLGGAAALNAVSPFILPGGQVFDTNRSHWAKALPPPNAPLGSDLEADVVVIGGGFTGLSAAYHLRGLLPGRRVVLLEAKTCGNGASGRNGAMVLTMTEDRYMRLGRDPSVDRRLYDLTAGNLPALQALADEVGVDCELDCNGALQVLAGPGDVDDARNFAERARDAGFPFEFWDRERTTATIGAAVYHGALFDPGSGQVHPGRLVGMWKTAALRRGVEIYDFTPVVAIEDGPVHRIVTESGHVVRAPALVLATNAYSPRLGWLRSAVAPVFDYVCMTPVLTEAQLAAAGWTTRIPFNDNRTETWYAGLTRDRRIHLGGGPVDYSFNNGVADRPDAAGRHAGVHRAFARLFPALSDVAFETVWAGSVDMSFDGSPAVGRTGRHQNIFYGIGLSGHGVNLSSILGRIMADLIAGRREAWTWLPFLDRLPPYLPNEPFRWLAVEAQLAYTRLTEG